MSVYEVKITHQAEIQMREIARYITVELKNPEAASNLVDHFYNTINELSTNPERQPLISFEPWRSDGVRWTKEGNYLIYFWIDTENARVQVIGIVYEKRDQKSFLKRIIDR